MLFVLVGGMGMLRSGCCSWLLLFIKRNLRVCFWEQVCLILSLGSRGVQTRHLFWSASIDRREIDAMGLNLSENVMKIQDTREIVQADRFEMGVVQ